MIIELELITTIISISLLFLSFLLAIIMTVKARRGSKVEVRFRLMKYYGQVLTVTLIVSIYTFVINPKSLNMMNLLAVIVLIIISWILAMEVW